MFSFVSFCKQTKQMTSHSNKGVK